MRSEARQATAGFTLVEVMIVVAIAALLSAVAIPAFSRYIKKSRTTEAIEQLNREWAGSLVYYESDHMVPGGLTRPRQFPGPTGAWASASECHCLLGQRCPASNSVWYADGVWLALNFSIADSHHYMPGYSSTGTGAAARFTAYAKGDIDCDNVLGEFIRTGGVNSGGNVTGDYQPVIKNELE